MNIIEATKQAIEKNKCIYDPGFPDVKMRPDSLMPFDIVYMDGSNVKHCWNPTGEDILSDTWELCD